MVRDFHWDGYTVRVESDLPEDVAWLEEYFCPPFEAVAGRQPDAVVGVRVDAERYHQLKALGPHPEGLQADLFSMDGRYESHPLWSGGQVHEPAGELFYLVEADRVEIVTPDEGYQHRRRVGLLRVVRELVSLCLQRRRKLSLHASALVWKGRAVAFLGARGAGKTTSLLSCLRCPGAVYLTNDRLALDLSSQRASAIPTILSLRQSSLRRLPHLNPLQLGSASQLSVDLPKPDRQTDKQVSGPAHLCRVLGLRRTGEAPLGALLFLSQNPRAKGQRTRALSPSEVCSAVASNLLYAGEPRRHLPLWPTLRPEALPEALRLPAYACEVGPDAFEDPESTARWLDQL